MYLIGTPECFQYHLYDLDPRIFDISSIILKIWKFNKDNLHKSFFGEAIKLTLLIEKKMFEASNFSKQIHDCFMDLFLKKISVKEILRVEEYELIKNTFSSKFGTRKLSYLNYHIMLYQVLIHISFSSILLETKLKILTLKLKEKT